MHAIPSGRHHDLSFLGHVKFVQELHRSLMAANYSGRRINVLRNYTAEGTFRRPRGTKAMSYRRKCTSRLLATSLEARKRKLWRITLNKWGAQGKHPCTTTAPSIPSTETAARRTRCRQPRTRSEEAVPRLRRLTALAPRLPELRQRRRRRGTCEVLC